MELLETTTNAFGGILTQTDELPQLPDEFSARLHHSLKTWRSEGYRVVWIEIPIALAALVPIAAEAGFHFHHSGEEYVMMTLRLEDNAFIPAHASHYIGAGGVVLSADQELLVVSEKYHSQRPGPPRYKLPGGTLHEGEHLAEAVVREVLEETGVRAEFEALVCFRHWHGYRYGKSDIYFVCRLRPLSKAITIQEEEIAECRWMPVEEYLNTESVSTFNKRIVDTALKSPGVTPVEIEGYAEGNRYEFFMPLDLEMIEE
jgi:8-oxo-dGTP pyrophosphatase MutT (NUDIX family)